MNMQLEGGTWTAGS